MIGKQQLKQAHSTPRNKVVTQSLIYFEFSHRRILQNKPNTAILNRFANFNRRVLHSVCDANFNTFFMTRLTDIFLKRYFYMSKLSLIIKNIKILTCSQFLVEV